MRPFRISSSVPLVVLCGLLAFPLAGVTELRGAEKPADPAESVAGHLAAGEFGPALEIANEVADPALQTKLFEKIVAAEVRAGQHEAAGILAGRFLDQHAPAVGKELKKTTEKTGFQINSSKTRMSLHESRQTVTGLVVNNKANISQDYYRTARAMCNSLFRSGIYFTDDMDEPTDNLNPLEGMLSHIYFVKARRDRPANINKRAYESGEFLPPRAPKELYQKFLFYKHFVALDAPLIVTEGVSDITYLQVAIRELAQK